MNLSIGQSSHKTNPLIKWWALVPGGILEEPEWSPVKILQPACQQGGGWRVYQHRCHLLSLLSRAMFCELGTLLSEGLSFLFWWPLARNTLYKYLFLREDSECSPLPRLHHPLAIRVLKAQLRESAVTGRKGPASTEGQFPCNSPCHRDILLHDLSMFLIQTLAAKSLQGIKSFG